MLAFAEVASVWRAHPVAHLPFTRMNAGPIIVRNQLEETMNTLEPADRGQPDHLWGEICDEARAL